LWIPLLVLVFLSLRHFDFPFKRSIRQTVQNSGLGVPWEFIKACVHIYVRFGEASTNFAEIYFSSVGFLQPWDCSLAAQLYFAKVTAHT
jgi:hypothetical protein